MEPSEPCNCCFECTGCAEECDCNIPPSPEPVKVELQSTAEQKNVRALELRLERLVDVTKKQSEAIRTLTNTLGDFVMTVTAFKYAVRSDDFHDAMEAGKKLDQVLPDIYHLLRCNGYDGTRDYEDGR